MLIEVWYLELGGLYHFKSDDLELCDLALIMPTLLSNCFIYQSAASPSYKTTSFSNPDYPTESLAVMDLISITY